MEQKINPNLWLLIGFILAMIGIMIGCEWEFRDGQIFTLFVGFINLLIGILVGAFKSVFHIPDNPGVPPPGTTSQVTETKQTIVQEPAKTA